MKIMFCNKYFFLNGGTERYLYNTMNYLKARGHMAIPFSVRYAGSWPSEYQDYFLEPPGDPSQAHLANIRFTPANILRFMDRSVYSIEARIKLSKLLHAVQGADIAYVLNIYNYMSPSIFHTFKKHHIPIVMQIGDYNLICPGYSLLRNGHPCTLCVQGQYYHGLYHRCVKNHPVASAVRVAAMYLHRLIGIYDLVDAVVTPCEFMKTMLAQGGFSQKKLYLLPYPVERRQEGDRRTGRQGEGRRTGEKQSERRIQVLQYPVERTTDHHKIWPKKNYIVYFGRISYEKGLDTLVDAFQKLNPDGIDLYIIGRSYDGEAERLKARLLPHMTSRIHFPGFMTGKTLTQWVAEALFSVVPSRWYDNAPLSIYESFLYGTPVAASRIGGIPEQVEDGVTGWLFTPNDSDDLARKMAVLLLDRKRLMAMGEAGKAFVKKNLLINDQMDSLVRLFEAVITDYERR